MGGRLVNTADSPLTEYPDGTTYKAYITATGLTIKDAKLRLTNDTVPDMAEELFEFESLPGYTAQDVCKYHRDNCPPGTDIHCRVILVFDTTKIEDGALSITLRADPHGYPDALRETCVDAALQACSLGVGCLDWQGARETAFAGYGSLGTMPRFALYSTLAGYPKHETNRTTAKEIDIGLHCTSSSDNEDEMSQVMENHELSRYKLIEDNSQFTVDGLCGGHEVCAEELGLDRNYFAVLDESYDRDGVLLVQIEPRARFRCMPPGAGELLWWRAIGFMTWLDAKEFAVKNFGGS